MLGEWRAIDLDTAGARGMHAVEDFENRRFPGAVLAEQSVNFAAEDFKIDIIEGANAAEMLGYAGHPHRARLRRRPMRRSRRLGSLRLVGHVSNGVWLIERRDPAMLSRRIAGPG